jgi:beta-lactamase class A
VGVVFCCVKRGIIWGMQKRDSYFILFVPTIVVLIIGVALFWYLRYQEIKTVSTYAPVNVREDSGEYRFINPLLFIRTKKELYQEEFREFDEAVSKYITKITPADPEDMTSVYLLSLNDSHWTGVNENATYEPGSMMKVAVLISYLELANKNPNILSQELYYPGYDAKGQHYPPSQSLSPGNYSVEKLLEVMITGSDNVAMAALVDNNLEGFKEVYKNFRLPAPPVKDVSSDYMSARSYSAIFRTLYNATYLSRDNSEKALELLTKTSFKEGIVAGVPEGITVAHKFGEHTSEENGAVVDTELHDCGIIYYPAKPYLLCVMTRGKNFEAQQKVIADISKIAYQFVDAQKN